MQNQCGNIDTFSQHEQVIADDKVSIAGSVFIHRLRKSARFFSYNLVGPVRV